MEISIYNENCTLAGREVSQSTIERWDDADGDPCDWTTYEGTPEELLAIAAGFDKTDGAPGRANLYWTTYEETPEELLAIAAGFDKTDGAPGRANLYGMRVAEVIRREVYRFHPELEPKGKK